MENENDRQKQPCHWPGLQSDVRVSLRRGGDHCKLPLRNSNAIRERRWKGGGQRPPLGHVLQLILKGQFSDRGHCVCARRIYV